MQSLTHSGAPASAASRRDAMGVLAESEGAELAALLPAIGPLPRYEELRRPECGLLMLRGRIAGDGAPFNVGEVTVARAAVRLETREIGFGYVLGRDVEKARLVAVCDALMQTERYRPLVEQSVMAPLRASPDRCAQACGRTAPPRRAWSSSRWCAGRTSRNDGSGKLRFADPVLTAQSAFRAIMDAVARPGTVRSMAGWLSAPAPLSPGAAAIAMTLFDQDTPVWLDHWLAAVPEVGAWLRFHTGAAVVAESCRSAFASFPIPAQLPPFDAFQLGTPEYPDRSTTLVLQVDMIRCRTGVGLARAGHHGSAGVSGLAAARRHRRAHCGQSCLVSARGRPFARCSRCGRGAAAIRVQIEGA